MAEYIKQFERDGAGNMTFAPFMANGNKYKFIKPGDPVGIEKWQQYDAMKVVVGFGRSFKEIVDVLNETQKLLGADKPFYEIRTEAILLIDSLRRGIIDMGASRHDKAFYLCSLFIYRDGTSPLFWSMDYANEMIDDWTKEGIDEQDLFFFALALIPYYKEIYNDLKAKADAQAARLLGITSLIRAKQEPTKKS